LRTKALQRLTSSPIFTVPQQFSGGKTQSNKFKLITSYELRKHKASNMADNFASAGQSGFGQSLPSFDDEFQQPFDGELQPIFDAVAAEYPPDFDHELQMQLDSYVGKPLQPAAASRMDTTLSSSFPPLNQPPTAMATHGSQGLYLEDNLVPASGGMGDQSSKNCYKWSPEEDVTLIRLRTNGTAFEAIATELPGRSDHSCRGRFSKLKDLYKDILDPNPTIPRWTKTEDSLLLSLGLTMPWKEVSKQLHRRTTSACENHYGDLIRGKPKESNTHC
jgi:hypothetical protein